MKHHPVISIALVCFSTASLSAQEIADQPPAGQGVLCLGTLIYIADDFGRRCKAGEDTEFQNRLSDLSERFDDYIMKNAPADGATLAAFKEGQGIGLGEPAVFCASEDVRTFYEGFRDTAAEKLEADASSLLRRDGAPTFGDCI